VNTEGKDALMIEPHDVPDSAITSPSSKHAPALLAEEVSRRAHAKWTARCETWNHQRQDWLEAEAELALEAAMSGQLSEARERIVSLFAEQQEAERRLVAMGAVSSILAVSETPTDAIPKLVQAIGQCFDWDVGAVWMLDRDANLLRCVEFWHSPQVEVPAFERDTRLRSFSPGVGMPGRVWISESIVWIPDVTAEADFPRASIAAQEGLRGAIAFPILNGVEFISVLEFFSREVRQPDEQLTEMMTSIASQISQFIERRSAERRLQNEQHDRRIGREIQQGLLPKTMPQLPGFEISGKSLAPNFVGGDCFDFIPLPKAGRDCIGVLVADASGHGIGAALLTGETRAYLRGVALTGTDVGLLLDLTNQCLSTDLIMSDHFVTAFLMRLDPSTRSLSYTSAGHLPGYILDPLGQTRAILESTGLPLGIDLSSTFPASTVSLEPGDLVLLITDGITEAASADGELFGMERTLRLVRQRQQQTPGEILTALFAAVGDYCNNNCLDDLTAVIIKVEGGG
jgi:serine phosphatase RsbU (regulator of sigma subunit)